MPTANVPETYYQNINQHLFRAVPESAQTILEVGCGEGFLGAALKAQSTARTVFGLERVPEVAARASTRLDKVFTLDVEADDPPIEPGTLDCILYGDVLEHLVTPESVLRKHRRLLKPDGIVLCSVPNVQHHSILLAILRSDFQYMPMGLLDATHLRFFTYSSFIKLLLDTGFEPSIADTIESKTTLGFLEAATPLMNHVGADPGRTAKYLDAYQYIFKGVPLHDAAELDQIAIENEPPLTIVACVSDESILEANLLRSPCLGIGSPHELLLMRGCKSAAEGLNRGIEAAKHSMVLFVHQDVYLPKGFPTRFARQIELAKSRYGKLGVAGVYGLQGSDHRGYIVDRDVVLHAGTNLPSQADALDEVLLAVPRDTPLRFDSSVGWHFYGADICLAAKKAGLSAVAIDALSFHNSLFAHLNDAFYASAKVFGAKWADSLPVITTCANVTPRWLKSLPLNARPGRWVAKEISAFSRKIRAKRVGRSP